MFGCSSHDERAKDTDDDEHASRVEAVQTRNISDPEERHQQQMAMEYESEIVILYNCRLERPTHQYE